MPEFDANAVIKRVRETRIRSYGARGKSRFARDLGLSPSTYNYYEKDRLPPSEVLLRIHELTGCDLYWLLTGRATQGRSMPQATSLNPDLFQTLETLLRTDPQAESAILAFAELLLQKAAVAAEMGGHTYQEPVRRAGWIPVLGRTAAGIVHFWQQAALPDAAEAVIQLEQLIRQHTQHPICDSARGYLAMDTPQAQITGRLSDLPASLIQVAAPVGQPPGEDQVVQFVDCRRLRDLYPDAFALQLDGDSMAPRINDGQIVILSPSVPAKQGQPAVVQLKDQIGVACKLVRITEHDVHLIPINEQYGIQTVPTDRLLWALAVLCHMCI